MSTKTQTSIGYDSGAKSAYDKNIGLTSGVLQGYGANPFNNPFFNMQKAFLQNQAAGTGQRAMNTFLSNLGRSGLGSGQSGFVQSQLGQIGRATSALQNQGLMGAMTNAQNMQQFALGQMMNFQPLMTGSTTTQSGLGTWLPQLAGAALGAGMGAMTGGASMMGGLGSMIGGAGNTSGFSGGILGASNPFHGMGGLPGGFGSFTGMAMPPSGLSALSGYSVPYFG